MKTNELSQNVPTWLDLKCGPKEKRAERKMILFIYYFKITQFLLLCMYIYLLRCKNMDRKYHTKFMIDIASEEGELDWRRVQRKQYLYLAYFISL
jgi:hypothetical protein